MYHPHQTPGMNARGRMLAARRHNAEATVWRTTHSGPRLGFFCRVRESIGLARNRREER